MSTTLEGLFEIEIYPTDHGLLAIEQATDAIFLSADQLLAVIQELHMYYETRARWREATQE
jgi:hypothetical protein